MFDDYARSLIHDFPEFDGLVRDNTTRALSSAYLSIIQYRINGNLDGVDELEQAQPLLRRITNTLFFHVISDGSREETERQAAAFVAAEGIALIADYLAVSRETGSDNDLNEVRSSERFTRIEASLLYLFARYDACAAGVLRPLSFELDDDTSIVDRSAEWAFSRLERLCRLKLFPPLSDEYDLELSDADGLEPYELEEDTIARMFIEIGKASREFILWLGGDQNGLALATKRLDSLISALSINDMQTDAFLLGYEFSRIFHLASLMRLCFPAIGKRALLHVVPVPPNVDPDFYSGYLRARAFGDADTIGRPVLWPSAFEYVHQCLLGRVKHSVAAMPTGSGKSFIGEIAVSQAIHDGWALYLAPTNALTEQIRADLRKGLKELGTEIFAFIGYQEYSIFSTDRVDDMPANSVAVMTPEKCALALRLSPMVFNNCRIVVFDECHLIGETGSSRGPVAELVLTQLMLRAPACRFLLMSAIVQNPDELAEWLAEATDSSSVPVTIRWRPTRTLRSVLGLDNKSIQKRAKDEIEILNTFNERIKRRSFKSKCALAVNLQGAWQSQEEGDYAVTPINCEAPLKLLRKKVSEEWKYYWEGDSWVNKCAIALGEKLAESGIQTLIFTPSNKHYPFSNGTKVRLPDQLVDSLPTANDFVEACKLLSEYELGCESQVFTLIDDGVAVHTSLMLETEKIGSELMFRSQSVPIMFATGTLAQGLNLPAIAVIIAGSRIGDPRGQDLREVQRRKFSQLLNAAGRAGRAGFANQGIVVAIPDKPVAFEGVESFTKARDQVDYLQQSDDSVRVQSGLTAFLDSVCSNALQSDRASDVELQVVSLLAGGDENQIEIEPILKRTYAAYLRRKVGADEVTDENADQLAQMGIKFIEDTGAPTWLTIAAQRAGLDFFLTLAISQAWARVRPELPEDAHHWSVPQWRDELLRLIVLIPPGILAKQLPIDKLKYISEEFKNIDKANSGYLYERNLNWEAHEDWVNAWSTAADPLDAWMQGKSYVEISSIITGISEEDIPSERTSGKVIPRVLSITHDSWSRLSLVAGGLLAIAEQILEGDVPLALASLPMCIKYGCDSPGTLAWFRFGVRLRRPSRLLSIKFPPPVVKTDDQLKEFVRGARTGWLNDDSVEEEPELVATRIFITGDE
jgi:superfamily II DNA/RNA helicase